MKDEDKFESVPLSNPNWCRELHQFEPLVTRFARDMRLNMENITLKEIIESTNGKLLTPDIPEDTIVRRVISDNRKAQAGDLFIAIVGEKMDGHKFVNPALNAGAVGAIVSKEPEEMIPGKFYVLVPDTLLAVGDLASYYRMQFQIPVIAVTGSVGKTTMKDMIASVLSEKYKVVATEGNYNNNIGVPRTLFRIDRDTEVAVVEMGMNHEGEIRYLTHMAHPTMAVITNIGDAHIGNLGSRENIFKAKCEIFEGLSLGGLAVMNADDEYLVKLKDDENLMSDYKFKWVGEDEDADFGAMSIDDTIQDGLEFTMIVRRTRSGIDERDTIKVPARGRHMIYPVLTATAIAKKLDMSYEEIIAGIKHYKPTAMRMETWKLGNGIIIYNDTYNANPQSMKAGLHTLANTDATKRIAVLGDMLELGDLEEDLHRSVGKKAAELSIDTLITIGKRARYIADEARRGGLTDITSYDDAESAKDQLNDLLTDGAVLYFKASHAMALEKLAQFCKDNA